MATWSEIQEELSHVPPENRGNFIANKLVQSMKRVAALYKRNVIFYASAFLQKPQIPGLFTSINREDINGFMASVHGLDFDKGLLLILHTPGGLVEAAQTIVGYLRSRFSEVDALVPTYAMSAGTMIALGCDRIILGRQSQLGPTDPQLIVANGSFSAHSIVAQFEEAKQQIVGNTNLAHAWAPILRSFGPALLEEARKSIAYGQDLVEDWLKKYMFSSHSEPEKLAKNAADYFGSEKHGSHGRRIDREEVEQQFIKVEKLEDTQDFQDEVLTLYHLSTITFENSPAAKFVMNSKGKMWVKNISTS